MGAGGPGGDSGPCAAQGSAVSNRAPGNRNAIFFMVLQCRRVESTATRKYHPKTARQSNFEAVPTKAPGRVPGLETEVRPGIGAGKSRARAEHLRVLVAAQDVVVGCVPAGAVADDQVARRAHINPAVVTRRAVRLNPVAGARHVNACAVAEQISIIVAGITG